MRRHGRLYLWRWNEVLRVWPTEVLWMRGRMTEAAMGAVRALMDIVGICVKGAWRWHELRSSCRRAIARAVLEGPWRRMVLVSKGLGVLAALGTHVEGSFVVMKGVRGAC